MDWHGKQMSGHGGGGQWTMPQEMPTVPAPMAFFGMAMALMVGITLGTMMSRKREMMGMMGGRPWGYGGYPMMGKHHHHGDGGPACCESHSKWPDYQSTGEETQS